MITPAVFSPVRLSSKSGSTRTNSTKRQEKILLLIKKKKKKINNKPKSQNQARKAKSDLQSAVAYHYPLFIDAAKEIGGLEADLSLVKTHLGELDSLVAAVKDVNVDVSAPRDTLAGLRRRVAAPPAARAATISARLDELDVLLAERSFGLAVQLWVELEAAVKDWHIMAREDGGAGAAKARAAEAALALRKRKLMDSLVDDLQNAVHKREDAKRIIATLAELGCAPQARYVFLGTRSAWIRKQVRRLKFHGDIAQYIGELAHLLFMSIRATLADFSYLFPDRLLLSGFIKWVTQELDFFADIFSRQVLTVDDFQTLADCLRLSLSEAQLLAEEGLDIGFYLERAFAVGLQSAIITHFQRIETVVANRLFAETWTSDRVDAQAIFGGFGEPVTLFLSESAVALYGQLRAFVEGVAVVFSHDLYDSIVQCICNLLESYLVQLSAAVTPDATDKKAIAAITNAAHITSDLVPRVHAYTQVTLQQEVLEIAKLARALNGLHTLLRDAYVAGRAVSVVEAVLGWPSFDYEANTSVHDNTTASPRARFVRLFEFFDQLRTYMAGIMPEAEASDIIVRLIGGVADTIAMGGCPRLSPLGADRLRGDLVFFVSTAEGPPFNVPKDSLWSAVKKILEVSGAAAADHEKEK
jgi:hypothetical protein